MVRFRGGLSGIFICARMGSKVQPNQGLDASNADPGAEKVPENDLRHERYQRPESVEALRKLPKLAFLSEGTGRTMPQAALRFVLDHPGVSCAIAGAKNRTQVEQNALVSEVSPMSVEEREKAFAVADTIRTPGVDLGAARPAGRRGGRETAGGAVGGQRRVSCRTEGARGGEAVRAMVKIAVLADLHLSDRTDTAAYAALQWAVEWVERERPDLLAVAGDVTTWGTAEAADGFAESLRRVTVPMAFTPGNSDLRGPQALPRLRDLLRHERRAVVRDDLLILLPDTSTGTVPEQERGWLEKVAEAHRAIPHRILITHYPADKLDRDSSRWLREWIGRKGVELLIAGHIHLDRERWIHGCREVTVRGLDPDKATGDLPGLALLECGPGGGWSVMPVPWSPPLQLLPADLPDGVSPVGWSIHGDPVLAVAETLDAGPSCLELRPREMAFSRKALGEGLRRLRARGTLYLSYHLPGLAWDAGAGRILGEEGLRDNLDCAMEAGVDHLTMHVPGATADEMGSWVAGEYRATGVYSTFEETFDRLFGGLVREGIRLAIENVHNPPGTPMDSPARLFGTLVREYADWIGALAGGFQDAPRSRVGAHLDLGHARNNGGDLDNFQPLGDWYAAVGSVALGYHIHQVDLDPGSKALTNHREIVGLFGPRISYAGFLWAWSTRHVRRGPLFVEVSDDAGRRRTVAMLKGLFDRADRLRMAVDLPRQREGGNA